MLPAILLLNIGEAIRARGINPIPALSGYLMTDNEPGEIEIPIPAKIKKIEDLLHRTRFLLIPNITYLDGSQHRSGNNPSL